MTLVVRADRAESLARPAVAALQAIDPNLAVTKVRTFESAVADSLARERLNALVSGSFALSALLLSSLGLYGLLAFLVTERTRELGIRIALGAQLARLAGSVVGGGLRLVAIGAAIGVAVSLALLRSFGALLFGVSPYDPATYRRRARGCWWVWRRVASYIPARRAAHVRAAGRTAAGVARGLKACASVRGGRDAPPRPTSCRSSNAIAVGTISSSPISFVTNRSMSATLRSPPSRPQISRRSGIGLLAELAPSRLTPRRMNG